MLSRRVATSTNSDKASLYVVAIEEAEYRGQKIHWWENVYGFDFSCIKHVAMKEPLVDNVEQQSICTHPCRLLSVNLQTVKKEELSFSSEFVLVATRRDNIHAIVAYFDIEFTQAHKAVYFTTSPTSKYTHWKQTVFYLDNVVPINPGERLTGRLACKPNGKNPRDLDIEIEYDFKGQYEQVHHVQTYWLR